MPQVVVSRQSFSLKLEQLLPADDNIEFSSLVLLIEVLFENCMACTYISCAICGCWCLTLVKQKMELSCCIKVLYLSDSMGERWLLENHQLCCMFT
ncbi:hypothetical protein LSH36_683g03028 [Paralvinella palmiformis]|uniref:Uncharacterized protein n=1 Tax=Paralvinella palmiformis TaxID=53620 RepID=A0AAD9J2Z7_9ANNE|nr:hypothetical protein LSH36_683g03028 [Paralvinella palmiformis]